MSDQMFRQNSKTSEHAIARKDAPMEPIKLDLVRVNGCEIICDQDGRSVDDVRDIKYEVPADGLEGVLTITLSIKKPKWDVSLGQSILGLKTMK